MLEKCKSVYSSAEIEDAEFYLSNSRGAIISIKIGLSLDTYL